MCFVLNGLTSMFFRIATAGLARESDMLVFISKSRYWHVVNIVAFVTGLGFTYASLCASDGYLVNGDGCLQEATGGSLTFTSWWFEWLHDDYPLGAGASYTKGEPIKNPWSVKAAELNLDPPLLSDIPGWLHRPVLYVQVHYDYLTPQDKELFDMYTEFMHDHFGLHGHDCFGTGTQRFGFFYVVLCLFFFPVSFAFIRNSRLYWLTAGVLKCAGPL